MKSASIVEMAGVGKAVALRIRALFPGGILCMNLGQVAAVENVIQEIVKILCLTGGKSIEGAVVGSTCLQGAADHAAH